MTFDSDLLHRCAMRPSLPIRNVARSTPIYLRPNRILSPHRPYRSMTLRSTSAASMRASLCFALKRSCDFGEFGRDPDDGRSGLREIVEMNSEIDRLDRAARGIVGGVEVDDHLPAAQRRQADAPPAIGRQHEIRGHPALFDAGRFLGIVGHPAFLSSYFRVFTDTPVPPREGEQRAHIRLPRNCLPALVTIGQAGSGE